MPSYEENLEKFKSFCSLSRFTDLPDLVGVLIEMSKVILGGWWKELRDICKETHGHLSNWTLSFSACVTLLGISPE